MLGELQQMEKLGMMDESWGGCMTKLGGGGGGCITKLGGIDDKGGMQGCMAKLAEMDEKVGRDGGKS